MSKPGRRKSEDSDTIPRDAIYHCTSLDEFGASLTSHRDLRSTGLIPELMHCRLVLQSTIYLPVNGYPDQSYGPDGGLNSAGNHQVKLEDALLANGDAPARLKRQRAVARALVELLFDIDGYRYVERRVYEKKAADGLCFMFICCDSKQNRDRTANYIRKKARASSDENDASIDTVKTRKRGTLSK